MKLKIVGLAVALLLLTGGYKVSAESNSNNGISLQLTELKTTVSKLVNEVKDILPLKNDIQSVKDELATAKTTISEQQKEIDSLKRSNEDLLSKFTQNERGDLYFEDKLIVKKDTVAPVAISNLRIVRATPEEVEVAFDKSPSTDVANYRIELHQTMEEITPIVANAGTETTYTFKGLKLSNPDSNYYVKVTAIDGHDNLSEPVQKGFEVIPQIPPIVSDAYVQWGTNGNGIDLWFGSIQYADSFEVYIDGKLVTTIQGNAGSYSSDIHLNTEHVIKLVARNKYGTSEKVINMFFG